MIPIRLIAAAVALAASFGAGWMTNGWRIHAGQAAAQESAAEDARLLARDRAATAERIDRAAVQTKRAAADRAAATAAVGSGLRVRLNAIAAGADAGECGAERARSAELARLLAEGSRLLEEGAGIAGEAVPMIDGLQARDAAR